MNHCTKDFRGISEAMKLDHASCPSSRNFLLHGRHDVQDRLTPSFHVQVHALTKNEIISNVRGLPLLRSRQSSESFGGTQADIRV